MNHATTLEKRFHPAGAYWLTRCRTCTWEKATASLPKAQKARDKHETTGK